MTDYTALAQEMFEALDYTRKRPPREEITQSMRGEMAVLRLLDREKRQMLAGEISKGLFMTTSRMAAVLGSLEKKGMICRCADPQDKRRVGVIITEEGRRFCCEKRERIQRDLRQMLEQLGERDAADLVRLTRRVIELKQKECKEVFDEEKHMENR